MTSWKRRIHHYIREQMPLVIFVTILFAMGVIFGALLVNALSDGQRLELERHFGNFLLSFGQAEQSDGMHLLRATFATQFKWLMLIWLLGLSVVGLPFVLLLDFFKGMLVGFTIGYLSGQFSWKGLAFALASVVPQNLLIIPAVLLTSVAAGAFAMFVIKHRILKRKGSLKQSFASFSLISCAMLVMLFAAALLESYITPLFLKGITAWMIA